MTTDNQVLKTKFLSRFNVDEDDLKKLCHDTKVRSLSIFGSSTQNKFKPGESDLDFLVEFESVSFDNFFDLLDGLRKLFHYDNIDLVTVASLKNQVIKKEILASQANIYAA